MKDINYVRLRGRIIRILERYLTAPKDPENIREARRTYIDLYNAMPLLDKALRDAVCKLVDIAWDLKTPRPSKKVVKKLILQLNA